VGKKRKRGDVLKSGYPIAERTVARMKREVRSKVVDLKKPVVVFKRKVDGVGPSLE